MSSYFHPGQVIPLPQLGETMTIVRPISAGAQGEVHEVLLSQGTRLVLKWYKPEYAEIDPDLANRLQRRIDQGPPNATNFAWPLHILRLNGVPSFGYLMRYAGPPYIDLRGYLSNAALAMSFRTLARAGYHLATAFGQLHLLGLCYHDISYGNVLVDPNSGDIIICDNDNVDVNGQPGAIGGSPLFKAPELVRREALPTAQTDLHALAVLLFFMLMVSDPLEGRAAARWGALNSPEAQMRIYGTDPIFIWDPADERNRPTPGLDDNAIAYWPIYPKFLQDLFITAFTTGLTHPDTGRVTESVWRMAMLRLHDSVFQCSACGKENFADDAVPAKPCWACRQMLARPPRLRGWSHSVVLVAGTRIAPHHIDIKQRYNFNQVVAEVVAKNGDPTRLGIRNMSPCSWSTTLKDGSSLIVHPERTLGIVPGTFVNFGAGQGEIVG
jgi:DNA-binding helix-hairpin-helix protein with protein kinase domain